MRTKNKNVTPVDSDSFFFITFQSWENLVENKLETSIRSARDVYTSIINCFRLYLNIFLHFFSNTLNLICNVMISSMTQMTR